MIKWVYLFEKINDVLIVDAFNALRALPKEKYRCIGAAVSYNAQELEYSAYEFSVTRMLIEYRSDSFMP